MMSKKAQAALEFLMTYGWAILVVLAAIGALAYFGVLNPSNFLPNKCVASPGWGCADKPVVTTTEIAQTIMPSLGYDIDTTTATITVTGTSTTAPDFCVKGEVDCASGAVTTLVDGTQYTMVIGGAFVAGQSVKEDVVIMLENPNSGLTETYRISLTGKI